MIQSKTHRFMGMSRDVHPINQKDNMLWEAHNIRLTARDGDSLMSITNERSTKSLYTFRNNERYIGHTVIGNYLILLAHNNTTDFIYRIDLTKTTITPVVLATGDLGFNPDYPAQVIADYESELVQKVYWVDGLNSPRVINIAKPELTYPNNLDGTESQEKLDLYADEGSYTSIYSDFPFGFVQELALDEEVSIEKLSSSTGTFPAGVVQYALTYCHKYGQESNIFYTSEPLYTSFADRGGSPEDKISTAFRITIKNVDTKFQFIRVYSIMRTSIDAVPTVKRVTDIDINLAAGEDQTISVVDNNTTGDTVDPSYLLFVGGKDIKAGCIAAKDNVLFLGDITYNRTSLYTGDLKDTLLTEDFKMKGASVSMADRTVTLKKADSDYNYVNQLMTNTSTFKNNETYRLGCRFQYKNGEWSEPVWIDDYVFKHKPILYNEGLGLGKMVATIPNNIIDALKKNGYKKAQSLIVIPSQKDRTILAQGILCPTVGQVGNRVQGGGAWSQSSWLLRPWASTIDGDGYMGSIPACKHNESLAFGAERCVELQTMAITSDASDGLMYTSAYDDMKSAEGDNSETSYGAFVVDQQIVTMHSPDIEFGDLNSIISSGAEIEVHKVGEVHFISNKGEIDIQTSTPVIDPDAGGFIKRSLSGDGSRSLISGLFYEDAMVDDSDDGKKFSKYMNPRLWMVYMWHRVGSLNNDCVRPEGSGTRTSELKKKCITNFKVSNSTDYLDGSTLLESHDIQSFNAIEVSLTRIKRETSPGVFNSCVYYGNVDTLIPAYTQYSYIFTNSSVAGLKNPDVPALFGNAITGGESKPFSQLKVTATVGTQNSIQGNVTAGIMPYIVETTTTIESNVASSSESSSLTGGDSNTNTDSNTTITSTGTKTTTVDIGGKAEVNINIIDGNFSGLVTLKEDATAADGTVVPANYSWTITGTTNYSPSLDYKKGGLFGWGHHHIKWQTVATKFDTSLDVLADSQAENVSNVGDYVEALKLSKDGVRMKYKSTPHAVISLKSPLTAIGGANLYLAELRQKIDENLRYGGKTKEALRNNLWIPAGPAVSIDAGKIEFLWGDTWFQRYDCLKTYPFTFEDQNQVTEIGSFFCETRVNIDGRWDRNRGSTSFSLSPVNFNLINTVYSQLNSFFNTRMLDDDYYKVLSYPAQIIWTGVKSPASEQDLWTNLHMASSLDMDGTYGRVTAIQVYNDSLVGFQERAVSQILFNSRVQVQASDGVPIEIANNNRVEGTRIYSNSIGCQDKFSMTTTPQGIYFVDNFNHNIYRLNNNGIEDIGNLLGTLYWARESYWEKTWRYNSTGARRNGIRLYYDPKFQDVYFCPGADNVGRDALCFSEQLSQFTSLMDYDGSVMFPHEAKLYSIADNVNTGVMTLSAIE